MRLPNSRATLVAGFGACLLLPFLAEAERLTLGLVIAGICTVLAGLGLRQNIDRSQQRVWLFLYLGLVSFVVGVFVRGVHAEVVGVEFPFPSPADVFVMAGYVLIFCGQLDLARARRHENNRADLLDALLLGALVGIPFWALGVTPFLLDSSVGIPVRLLDGAYSVITIALVVATALLAVGPGKRNPSYYLLACSMLILFVIDTGAILHDMGYNELGWFISYAFPAAFIAYAAAALNPEIARLTDRPELQEPRLTRQRLAILVAAVLVVPLLLMYEVSRDHGLGIVLTSCGSAVIALLVLARMTDLVRANERSIAMERIRSATAERLVSAAASDDIAKAVMSGVMRLADARRVELCMVLLERQGDLRVVASADPRWPESASQHSQLPVFMAFGDQVHASVIQGQVRRLPGRVAMREQRLYVIPSESESLLFPLLVDGLLRGLVVLSAEGHIDRATERVLDSIVWEACLALQSVDLRRDLALQQTERRYRAMFENSSDLVCVLSPDGRITFSTPTSKHVLGLEPSALVGSPLSDIVHEQDRAKALSLLRGAMRDRTQVDPLELRIRDAGGAHRWFEVLVRDLRDEPEIGGLVLNARDVSDRRVAEQQLATNEARFRSLVQNSTDIVAVLDDRARFRYLSPAVTSTLGYRPEDLMGSSVFDLLDKDENRERAYNALWATSQFQQKRSEIAVQDRLGRSHTLAVTLTDLRTEPAVGGIVLNARDVSDNRELEQSLRHQALHDALTGLANRESFANVVAEALTRDGVTEDSVAVLFVDIDDFKTVNDSLGHDCGDHLLVTVSERIRNCLRLSDSAARLGGDEFAILLEPTYVESELEAVAERVLDSLREPVDLQGREISVTASIGIARNSGPNVSSDVLLRNADMAMHIAKQDGKARFQMFREHMHAEVSERLEMKAALAVAIDAQELLLYYQPIVGMDGSSLHGAEALVRWRHPTRGVLGPGAFIGLAEETGLIVPMGAWILDESIRQLSVWQQRGLVGEAFTLDVNLSVLQLRDPSIVSTVASALSRHSVDPSSVAIEITESLLVDDGSGCEKRLGELRALGVKIAVDDFGTGYSSLGYIHRFPVDVIKIDRSFVDGLGDRSSGKDPTVARTIIELANQIGAITVAEGIEQECELEVLANLGCDLAQGFLFARPVPPAEFVGMITANGHRPPLLNATHGEIVAT